LLQGKKIHLREDFEPWHAVDIMDKEDREAVFRRAGTKTLPIVFIDDEYIGDYDKLVELEEASKLDPLLNMKKQKVVSEEEHMRRLKGMGFDGEAEHQKQAEAKTTSAKPGRLDGRSAPGTTAPSAPSKPAPTVPTKGPAFCKECGSPNPGAKFCAQCGATTS